MLRITCSRGFSSGVDSEGALVSFSEGRDVLEKGVVVLGIGSLFGFKELREFHYPLTARQEKYFDLSPFSKKPRPHNSIY
jgi:hypothetical protein